eukprot:s1828_g7.t1
MPVVDFYMKGVTNEELNRVSFVCTCTIKEDMDRVSKELNLNLDTEILSHESVSSSDDPEVQLQWLSQRNIDWIREIYAADEAFYLQHCSHCKHSELLYLQWELRTQLIAHNGSVQKLDLPEDMKELYKTVWEIKQKIVLDMAADRGPYIDQSQSLNIHMIDATAAKITSMHFHGWQRGLKTGMYYLRTKAAADAIKFTVEVKQLKPEENAIKALKSEAPKYSCVGCSA